MCIVAICRTYTGLLSIAEKGFGEGQTLGGAYYEWSFKLYTLVTPHCMPPIRLAADGYAHAKS